MAEAPVHSGAIESAQRRWYNGQHSCLPSSWSGFDSRPTQYFFYFRPLPTRTKYTILTFRKIYSIPGVQKGFPTPGIEPGPPGWEPGILTTRPYRIGCSMWGLLSRDTLMGQQQVSFHRWYSSSSIHMPLWRNRLARSAVNREAGGSSPPRGATFCFAPPPFSLTLSHFGRHKTSIEWPYRVPGSLV